MSAASPLAPRDPRVLLLTHSCPLPETRGGNQRTSLLIRALQRIAEVDFIYIHRDFEPVSPTMEQRLREEFDLLEILRPWGGPGERAVRRVAWKVRALIRNEAVRVGLIGHAFAPDRNIKRAVRAQLQARDYDVVIVRYLEVAAVAEPFGPAPVVVDADDLETTRYEAAARAPGVSLPERIAARIAHRRIQKRVPGLLARCAHVWLTSAADRRQVEHPSATVLPNIPFAPPSRRPAPAPDTTDILLVASLKFEVNRQAVAFFVRRIWPLIHNERPVAVLRIAGAGTSDRLKAEWSRIEGVEPLGFVPDLAAEYSRCLFTVAPLFHGGGTKIKVLEALAHRRACVTTAHTYAGFAAELPADEALVVASSPTEFASRCIGLLDDPESARRIADRGAEIVRQAFSFDRFAERVAKTIQEVGGG